MSPWRKRAFLGLGVFVACILPAQNPPSRIGAAIENAAARGSTLDENLRRLTDEVGGRRTGSPEMRRAVDWGIAAFRKAGVDSVQAEAFKMPSSWSEGATRIEVVAPVTFRLRAVSVGWSPAIAAPGITAPVIDAREGSHAEITKIGPAAKGAILLVHTGTLKKWDDLFAEYNNAPGIIRQAKKAGAAAILWMSTRERDLLYRHQNTLDGQLDALPQAIVAREDALRVARLIQADSKQAGSKVRIRLALPNQSGGPAPERNVVAEIRGSEKPAEIVVLGAHLDSWDLGSGALDNGCNAALVVEAARLIKASGVRPRRTIRFVLFSGEEQGMLGSLGYVRAHRQEMDRTVAAIVFDEGTGKYTGFSLGGRGDIKTAIEQLAAGTHTVDAFVGTDNLDFLLEGVPTLVANQEEGNYLENYHAMSDTFDKVDLAALNRHTVLAAQTALAIADRADRLGPRQSRSEIEKLMKTTGLDEQMKNSGLWATWEAGKRGRAK